MADFFTAVTTSIRSCTECYIIVWVEGSDKPVYACTAPLLPSWPCASKSSEAAAVPAVDVVMLKRFFSALALLSCSPPRTATAKSRTREPRAVLPRGSPFTRDTTKLLRTALPQGLVSAYGASSLHYCVAVLAPGTVAALDNRLLAWLACGVLAALPLGAGNGGGAVALITTSVGYVGPHGALYQVVLAHSHHPHRGTAVHSAASYLHYVCPPAMLLLVVGLLGILMLCAAFGHDVFPVTYTRTCPFPGTLQSKPAIPTCV